MRITNRRKKIPIKHSQRDANMPKIGCKEDAKGGVRM